MPQRDTPLEIRRQLYISRLPRSLKREAPLIADDVGRAIAGMDAAAIETARCLGVFAGQPPAISIKNLLFLLLAAPWACGDLMIA
jgi:hypothetical protein